MTAAISDLGQRMRWTTGRRLAAIGALAITAAATVRTIG
jgi:hypothetical protein